MEKKTNSATKRLFWIVMITIWILAAFAATGVTEGQKGTPSPGEAIGEAARQVKEDSKTAYHSTKEAVVQTSRKVVDGARNAFRESKDAGTKMVKDVRKGFKKQPSGQGNSPRGGHRGAASEESIPKE